MSDIPRSVSAFGCGVASVLVGPLTLYSLLTAVARWTPWDFTANTAVVETVLAPYLAFQLPMLMLYSPMSLAYLKENAWTIWLLTTVAYFVAGALLCVGVGYVSDRIGQRRADAIARERNRKMPN
jgi:hypothetical protein